jgi:WD40 repeat protein
MPGLSDLFRGSQPRLTRRWKAEVEDHVISLTWSPSGQMLAAAAVSGPIVLFDAAGKHVHTLAGHGFGTTSVSFRYDGGLLASAGQDGKVRLWSPETGQQQRPLEGGAAWVEHVLWHPSADRLASAAGKKLRLWSSDGTLLCDYPDQAATIADVAWRPGSNELASATYGGVTLWSMEASQEAVRRLEWRGSVLKMAWTADGARLAHGNQDATVHYWILSSGQDMEMAGYPMKVRELCWDPTGTYLATGGGDAVTVWDCAPPGPENSEPLSFQGHEATISALVYQARGPLLTSGGQDGKVLLFRPGKFKKALAQSDAGAAVSQVVWSPDDRSLAVGTEAGGVVVYSVG